MGVLSQRPYTERDVAAPQLSFMYRVTPGSLRSPGAGSCDARYTGLWRSTRRSRRTRRWNEKMLRKVDDYFVSAGLVAIFVNINVLSFVP